MGEVPGQEQGQKLYKIVPYYEEKRGNLRMVGLEYPVEYKQIDNILLVHVKENLVPEAIALLSFQLKSVFGEGTLLLAFKNDVSFFVAEPMSDEEVKEFREIAKEKAAALVGGECNG